MRKIQKIILHCSDSDIPAHDNIDSIRDWHLARGWNDIGYHYVITWDGCVYTGRQLHQVGAHCSGENADSVGICLTGRWRFSEDQKAALFSLVHKIARENFMDIREVYPHNHFNKHKTCPNFELDDFYIGSKQEKMDENAAEELHEMTKMRFEND